MCWLNIILTFDSAIIPITNKFDVVTDTPLKLLHDKEDDNHRNRELLKKEFW